MRGYAAISTALLLAGALTVSLLLFPAFERAPASTEIAAPASRSQSASIQTYVVKKGDTLLSIASEFGVSPNTIAWANHLSTSLSPQIGQALVILPVVGIEYTVKPGDTLQSVASRFGVSTTDISTLNGISGASITAGSEIIVPASTYR